MICENCSEKIEGRTIEVREVEVSNGEVIPSPEKAQYYCNTFCLNERYH
jgi:hypothetical protein